MGARGLVSNLNQSRWDGRVHKPPAGLLFYQSRQMGVLTPPRACRLSPEKPFPRPNVDYNGGQYKGALSRRYWIGGLANSWVSHPCAVSPVHDVVPLKPAISNSPRSLPLRDGLPALPLQEQLWFMQHLARDVGVANIAASLHWRGSLDPFALQTALADLVVRHPYLRTTVEFQDEGLVQVPRHPRPVPVLLVDLRALSPVDREAELRHHLAVAAGTPFGESDFPWVRGTLIRLADDETQIALTVSHLVCDGLSMGILCRELIQAYEARCRGQAPAWRGEVSSHLLAAPPRDTEQTARVAVESPLIYDFVPPPQPTYRGRQIFFELSEEESRMLVQLSRRHQVSPFVTWLALLQTMLFRYSGSAEISVDVPMAGRTEPLRREVAPLMKTVPQHVVIRDGDRLADLIQSNRRRLSPVANAGGAAERQAMLANTRSRVLLDYQTRLNDVRLGDTVHIVPGELDNGAAVSEFCLGVRRSRGGFSGHVKFDCDLFSEQTADRFIALTRYLLRQLSANSDTVLSQVSLLTDADRILLEEVNATQVAYQGPELVDALFAAQVQRSPAAIAMVCNGQETTYAQLDQIATRIAGSLRDHGVRHDDRVGLLLDREMLTVASMLAILKCGAAYVPIDPAGISARQQLVFEGADLRCVVTSAAHVDQVPAKLPVVDVQQAAGEGRTSREATTERQGTNDRQACDLAYILFTSGSTGKPKGVQVTHRNLAYFFAAMDSLQVPGVPGVWLAVTNTTFDISVYELLWTLTRGYQVILESNPLGHRQPDAISLADKIRRYGVTHFQGTPALIQLLLRDDDCRKAMGNLQKVFVGGESLPPSLAQDLCQVCRGDIYNMYGPTETTIWSMAWKLDGSQQVRIGRPLPNTRIYVMDQSLRLVPVGVAGELIIGGDGVSQGYFRNHVESNLRFVDHPELGRVFRTGDTVRMVEDGNCIFLGRRDAQVKLHGHRVELGDIEATLRQHPDVEDIAVVLRGDQAAAENLVAFARFAAQAADGPARLLAHARKHLPPYMVPARICAIDAMPLNPSGKIDRMRLMLDPLPDDAGGLRLSSPRPASPTGSLRDKVRELVREQLRLDGWATNVRLQELSVSSLDMVRLVERVEREFGVSLPLVLLFQDRSVEEVIYSAVVGNAAPHRSSPDRPQEKPAMAEYEEGVI